MSQSNGIPHQNSPDSLGFWQKSTGRHPYHPLPTWFHSKRQRRRCLCCTHCLTASGQVLAIQAFKHMESSISSHHRSPLTRNHSFAASRRQRVSREKNCECRTVAFAFVMPKSTSRKGMAVDSVDCEIYQMESGIGEGPEQLVLWLWSMSWPFQGSLEIDAVTNTFYVLECMNVHDLHDSFHWNRTCSCPFVRSKKLATGGQALNLDIVWLQAIFLQFGLHVDSTASRLRLQSWCLTTKRKLNFLVGRANALRLPRAVWSFMTWEKTLLEIPARLFMHRRFACRNTSHLTCSPGLHYKLDTDTCLCFEFLQRLLQEIHIGHVMEVHSLS